MRLNYNNQPVNSGKINIHCSFLKSQDTREYSMGAKCKVFKQQNKWYT